MFPFSTFISVRSKQLENAYSPIVLTEFGIVMCVRDEQSENAVSPIVVTEFGIFISVRAEQPEYLQPIITQYFASNKSEIWS